MITERVGDLLTETDLTHIVHQANLYHCFGAGLAVAIARRYPYSEHADARTPYGDKGKLGTYSLGIDPAGLGPVVVNLYSQHSLGGSGDHTDYEALNKALNRLTQDLYAAQTQGVPVRLGVPYRLGCGLAGGRWPKVYGMLERIFGPVPLDVVVVKLPEEV